MTVSPTISLAALCAVLGGGAALAAPPPAVAPVVIPEGKACQDSQAAAVFFSPRQPNARQPLRVIATLSADPGPVDLVLVDPAGHTLRPEVVRQGGPPWSWIATVPRPAVGTWTVALGNGGQVAACLRLKVKPRAPEVKGDPAGPVWVTRRSWTEATENLWATFIERLFGMEFKEDQTWPDLQTLLRDPEHNLLFDHLSLGEEAKIALQPDCADLPYDLRAYFAWKMGLPFGFLSCERGPKRSIECKEEGAGDNLMSRSTFPESRRKDVEAFAYFVRAKVQNGVSSQSARTPPDDDLTDYYPIELTREALRPGMIFADPYGHIIMIVRWIAQEPPAYGLLVGADAQPDGTIGRRRFWRGSFLFLRERVRGAGFKAFRPRIFKRAPKEAPASAPAADPESAPAGDHLELMENGPLRHARWFKPWSDAQYRGSVDDFYDALEALINPRPLDAVAAQRSLVDALEQSVLRRVQSVDLGEKFMVEHPGEVMVMPEGAKVFLTTGPWEDFATPSRDFRLLISIDTVVQFPAAVKRRPERFGLTPGPRLDAYVAELTAKLHAELRSRKFTYVRSDGVTQTLTLKDVVDRAPGFEMSYNPNDCMEIRWGAPAGSPEMASCRRRAPEEQQRRMSEYRTWFARRQRPLD